MKKLTALRQVETSVHALTTALTTLRAELQRHGYQIQLHRPVAGMRYLRFHGQFEDSSHISGLLNLSSWASAALPALEGIDWLSMEDSVLQPLIAEHPVQLALSNQHAPFVQMSEFELITEADLTHELPAIEALPGTVIIERFIAHATSDISEMASLSHLHIPLTFSIGYSVLPAHSLTTIEVGDVLLIEHIEGRVTSHGKTLFTTELNGESIMILNRTDNEKEQHDVLTTSSAQTTGLNSLPIELSVVLMEKVVPLAQLKTITPGEIIELPPEVMFNVKILANQRCFAHGELIQLANGQLGVEIRTLWPQE